MRRRSSTRRAASGHEVTLLSQLFFAAAEHLPSPAACAAEHRSLPPRRARQRGRPTREEPAAKRRRVKKCDGRTDGPGARLSRRRASALSPPADGSRNRGRPAGSSGAGGFQAGPRAAETGRTSRYCISGLPSELELPPSPSRVEPSDGRRATGDGHPRFSLSPDNAMRAVEGRVGSAGRRT